MTGSPEALSEWQGWAFALVEKHGLTAGISCDADLRERIGGLADQLCANNTATQRTSTKLLNTTRQLRELLKPDDISTRLALVSMRAIEVYGEDYELGKFQEETAEASAEAAKYRDHRGSHVALASETADVIITASHVDQALPAGMVAWQVKQKLDRLEQSIRLREAADRA